jgi:hypothetical protein
MQVEGKLISNSLKQTFETMKIFSCYVLGIVCNGHGQNLNLISLQQFQFKSFTWICKVC